VLAAAVAIPLFIALYLLRLRRQRQLIPSTLLWRQATRDLEVNAPLRKLRSSLLFILQLLLLGVLIAAIGEPALRGGDMTRDRLVILIDRSASMNAKDGPDGMTRLSHALQLAEEMIDLRAERSDEVMTAVLAFGASADVVQGFSTNARDLKNAIRAIEPTDEEADFKAALNLAGSFAAPAEEGGAGSTQLVIISDGAVQRAADSNQASVAAAFVRFVQAGPSPGREQANVGFVSISARRDPMDPALGQVFVRLISSASTPRSVNITLRIDSEVSDVRTVTVPAMHSDGPGEATYLASVDIPGGAFITLTHDQVDALPSDDQVSLVIPAPRQPRLALVHAGESPDPYLLQLLEAMEPDTLRVLDEAAYSSIDPVEINAGSLFDVIVFDRVHGYELPSVPTLSFGGWPSGASPLPGAVDEGQRIMSWDRQHPVLRHVSLDTVLFAGTVGMTLPEGAHTLASGARGPLIAVHAARGAQHVMVAFALTRSNWPRELSVTIFMQNVLEYLWLGRANDQGLSSRPGEPVTVRAESAAQELQIEGASVMRLRVEGGELATLPSLRRAGVYSVRGAAPPMNVVAVNVSSDLESFTQTRDAISVNARTMTAGALEDVTPRPIWTWALMAAMLLLTLEWLLFLALKRQ